MTYPAQYKYVATITCPSIEAYAHLVEKIAEYQADPTNLPLENVDWKPQKLECSFVCNQIINF